MFSYYVDLGVRALSRNPLVTGLIVILIAVGVAIYPVWRASRIQPAWQLKIG